MEETFKLHHAALYSKCWYKRSGDIWSDLRKTMSCDGYSGDIMDKGDNITCSILSISFISVNGLGLLIILAMYIQSII